jgi:regulator of protease activity HflC (stomatin/prohibitin superfamily)
MFGLIEGLGMGTLFAFAFLVYVIVNIFRIVPQYERLVIYRLGKLIHKPGGHGPGLVIVLPVIDQVKRVSIRTVAIDVPPQDIITKDNVSLQVNAVLYYRVIDPELAMNEVEDYIYATGQLAQTTLRSVCGQMELDELLGQREEINHRLQNLLDAQTEPWGIKVANVELKNVDLPKDLQRAIGRQAEAERERRAKIIAADGELEASEKLSLAATKMANSPNTLQLRYLQTLMEISSENTKTIIFPVPMDLIDILQKKAKES